MATLAMLPTFTASQTRSILISLSNGSRSAFQRSVRPTRASTDTMQKITTQNQRVSSSPSQKAFQSTLRNARYTSRPATPNSSMYLRILRIIFFADAIAFNMTQK